jgi:hypothetical protein
MAPVSGNPSAVAGKAPAQPLLAQPGFLSAQPFAAYLLSLTDPAAQALAALSRAVTAPAAAPSGTGLGAGVSAVTALLTTGAVPALAAASPVAAREGAPERAATASAALPLVQAFPDAGTDTQASSAVNQAEPVVQDAAEREAEASAANAPQTANLAAAGVAANVSAGTSPADAVAADSAELAVDATAKFMGAGVMAQPARALSAYQAIQDAIPAVNGVLAASAMAAYTSSNPEGRDFGQTAGAHPAPGVPAPRPVEPVGLNLLT